MMTDQEKDVLTRTLAVIVVGQLEILTAPIVARIEAWERTHGMVSAPLVSAADVTTLAANMRRALDEALPA